MSDIKFGCPKCSQHISCNEKHRGREAQCPSCGEKVTVPFPVSAAPQIPRRPGQPFPHARAIAFTAWLVAGVLLFAWYGNRLTRGEVHIYALNGFGQPVSVFYRNEKVAQLRPDETRLIKLKQAGGTLEVIPTEASGGSLGIPEEGIYVLNLGTGYWITARNLEYSSSYLPSVEEPKRIDRPGLLQASRFVSAPFQVCEFGESAPGSVRQNSDHPQLKLGCGSNSGRQVMHHPGWLGPLTMSKDLGFFGALLPGGIIAFVWLIGLIGLVPRQWVRPFVKTADEEP